jgi:hypothetical protein
MTWESVSGLGYVQDQALQTNETLLSGSEVALASLCWKQPSILNDIVSSI